MVELSHLTTQNRVLIVDDEAGIRDLFSMILSHDLPEAALGQACNGQEAVEHFREYHDHVLIMDLHMPVMDGLTAFSKIAEICTEDSLEMPAVVFCTGYAPPDAVRRIVSTCVRHHLLSKPVRSETLVDTIRSRLDLGI
jgi:YesN/AraC family two-component response regulator